MKKTLALLLSVLMLVSLTSGIASAESNKLTAYTAYQEDEVQYLFNEFEKDTGIKVHYVRLSAGELFARIQAEAENPQASLWFATSIDTMNVAAEQGYIEPYTTSVIEEIPESLRDPNGFWTAHTLAVMCFANNDRWLEESGAVPPESWEDLLDPMYEGEVVVAHPGTSGVAYAWLSSLVSLMGEEEAIAYMQKLDKSIIQYTKGGSAPARMSGLGEAGVGLCWSSDAKNAMNGGYQMTLSYPSEGTPFEVTGMALIKNGPADELENAQAFIDWAASKKAQELFVNEYSRLPANATAELPEGVTAFSDITTIDVDRAFASENRERLINLFEDSVRGSDNVLQ